METPPTPNTLMGSRKKTQKKTPNKQKQVSYRKTVICMKQNSHNNLQNYITGTTEIQTKFNPVRQIKIIQRQRTSFTTLSQTKNTQVSTELKLFDDTWPTENMSVAKEYFEGVEKKREAANSKIARMKHYSPEEEEEESLKGVSTKLTLYTDPWNIKKKLTQSDLGHLCRLLLQTSLVEKYVLPFLSAEEINEAQRKEGLRIMVLDQDTESQHSLIMKKWSTSKSYVLIDGWGQKFVNRRNLNPGDEIGFYWDRYTSMFNFSVIQRAE